MLRSSIRAVFVSVYGFSGAFDISLDVQYISGRQRRFKFSSWNSDDLPVSAVCSVPRSVLSFIDSCICNDYVTVLSGDSWNSFNVGYMFREAAHA